MSRPRTWQCVGVTELPVGPAEWLTVPDVAELLGIPVNRVHQLVRDHALIAVRESGVLRIPAEFILEGAVVKHLPGVLTLLLDAGYNDDEALRWLYTPDESLPGTPAEALRGNRATEVKRRAQALGF
ncbi:Rv2175c family DNA-binding protein [Dactylosporangium sp. AC04546]|uniref:Rv2175c family DNA-binding protein n=1 Tax=Dactylosporangium sp. AC04546 TaxID=2862460 RepID=UPI003FA43EF1